jgi:dipeptidyl aminopeptidase/acylaminoacyl peptidase
MATNDTTGELKKIWDPNPKFADIQLGEATIYKWRDKAGHEWSGGLLKPPDYVPGRRYPLVFQTHGFNEKEFLTDGAFPTAMAARPMAARGMLVLQVGGIPIPPALMLTPQEAEMMRDGYVAAIDQLDAEGLIDSNKVGIIGFSHTGWYVLNALLHAKKYFAAATLAECTYISFGEYIMNADYSGQQQARARQIASALGSEPFGAGLQKWIADSAGFNTDKIETPVFFEANSPAALIYSWDVYAAMRLQNKPVELLYMRNGEHVLRKPQERLASQEMNVDWYDFWLNGHEDSDPAKADQYARWREMRKVQERN